MFSMQADDTWLWPIPVQYIPFFLLGGSVAGLSLCWRNGIFGVVQRAGYKKEIRLAECIVASPLRVEPGE
jgi:hypothetical protein